MTITIHPLILVSGSRHHSGRHLIETALTRAVGELTAPCLIIHGACRTGADAIADAWGRRQRTGVHDVQGMDANWDRYKTAAGPIRNQNLVERAWVQQHAGATVIVLAFPLGQSLGTHGLIKMAKAAKLNDIRVITV